MRRDFTATAFVIDSEKRVLLVWHKKFQKWMPPGGHLDPHELPEDGAKRECKEETGIEIEIEGQDQFNCYTDAPEEGCMLPLPYLLLLENVPAHAPTGQEAHQHIDFVFLAHPVDETQLLDPGEQESSKLRWFTAKELEALPEEQLFGNVRASLTHILARA